MQNERLLKYGGIAILEWKVYATLCFLFCGATSQIGIKPPHHWVFEMAHD